MTASPLLKDHVADLVEPWGEVTIVRYFGGWALRTEGAQVGIVMDALYVAAELLDAAGYDAEALEPFRYVAAGKTVTVGRYRAVPPELLDHPTALHRLLTARD